MEINELQLAIADDVKRIQNLEPKIVPAKIYYGNLLKVASGVFAMFFLIIALTLAYTVVFNNHDKAPIQFHEIASSTALIAFLISAAGTLFLFGIINFYVLFQFHLEKNLRTGSFITQKLHWIFQVFFGFLMFFCVLFGSYADGQKILLLLVFSLFGSLGATCFLVRMELNRIGFSALFTLLQAFVKKPKE